MNLPFQKICSVPVKNLTYYLWQRVKLKALTRIDSILKREAIVEKHFFGTAVKLNFMDIDQRALYSGYTREPENVFVYQALNTNKICNHFVDIGANYGHEALLLINDYEKITLVEANPVICSTLKLIFSKYNKVDIINAAVVEEGGPEKITLKIPLDSSALASTVDSPKMRDRVRTVQCDTITVKDLFKNENLSNFYIKIDIEGGEYSILKNASQIIKKHRAIVSFEALSPKVAQDCTNLFESDYSFYYSKFDCMDENGSFKNGWKLLLTFFGIGKSISIFKINKNSFLFPPNEYTQLFCVPVEKSKAFESAIFNEKNKVNILNMKNLYK